MHAYDIEPGDWHGGAPVPDSDGWCFGLPPGIAAAQWPLDPWSGYPMQHGFTLRLPPDYRVHGPDIVAVSFFATAPDHNDGGPAGTVDGMHAAIATPAQALADPALQPFRERALQAHPRLRRMQDVLDCAYALILLRQEGGGWRAMPAAAAGGQPVAAADAAAGMAAGRKRDSMRGVGRRAARRCRRRRTVSPCIVRCGCACASTIPMPGCRRARRSATRPIPAAISRSTTGRTAWVSREHYREHDWGRRPRHQPPRPAPCARYRASPTFSPYYIEFDEAFGGYNFGGGIAQLDIQGLRLDWACD